MDIIEFNKAFNVDELKNVIDNAMLQAVPANIKAKWRNVENMILMNQNPNLATKIKIWDIFAEAGFVDATQESALFYNKIISCPDIDIIRNIVYIEDVWQKWAKTSLLLSKEVSSKKDSEDILNTMLQKVDDGSVMGSQVRSMINDHPQIDLRYKHFDAAIEKVLYNNGKIVSTNYTIAPDGVNVSIGGRKYVCGSGNGLYLDARGALRVSPKWRLVFLPDGNYAIEDSSHAIIVQGDLGTISGFCGANFGVDIVKVLRDNNIEANLSNNSSTGQGSIQESIQALIDAKKEAIDLLEQLEACVKNTIGNYTEEIAAAKNTVKKRMNAIDRLLYHYDVDPETCLSNNNKQEEPATLEGSVTENIQPLFDHIGDINVEEKAWMYDLINTVASTVLTKEDDDSEEYTAKDTFKGNIKEITKGLYGIVQIDDVKEVSKTEVECSCIRLKGDIDDTYTDWKFTLNTNNGEYTVSLKSEDNPENASTIFSLYNNAKAIASENADRMMSLAKSIKDVTLSNEEEKTEDSEDKDINESVDKKPSVTNIDLSGKDIIVEISNTGLNKMDPIISKCRLSNKSTMEYNGSIINPYIIIKNTDMSKNNIVAEIKFSKSNTAVLTIKDKDTNIGKTIGDILNV